MNKTLKLAVRIFVNITAIIILYLFFIALIKKTGLPFPIASAFFTPFLLYLLNRFLSRSPFFKGKNITEISVITAYLIVLFFCYFGPKVGAVASLFSQSFYNGIPFTFVSYALLSELSYQIYRKYKTGIKTREKTSH